MEQGRVRQMRLVVEVDDHEEAVRFYRDVLGGTEELDLTGTGGERVTILDMGRATLELSDPAQVEMIDRVEVGRRVSPRLRVGFQVEDAAAATRTVLDAGAKLVAPPTLTPWSSLNSRLEAPTGLQVTLFEELEPRPRAAMGLRLEIFPDDLDAVVDFYTGVLAFELERDERGTPAPYVALRRGTVRIGAARRDDAVDLDQRRPPAGTEVVLEVDDVRAERDAVARLWPLEEDLVQRPWGLTDFRLLDPAGYYLRITGR